MSLVKAMHFISCEGNKTSLGTVEAFHAWQEHIMCAGTRPDSFWDLYSIHLLRMPFSGRGVEGSPKVTHEMSTLN